MFHVVTCLENKAFCFISTSAHTNYLIKLLKSVAFLTLNTACRLSQARRIFYSAPIQSQSLFCVFVN